MKSRILMLLRKLLFFPRTVLNAQTSMFFCFLYFAQARRTGGTRSAREASRDDFDGADVEGQA